MEKYDLIVIGSGPAGEKAAAKAAYFGKKVALIEKQSQYGGAGVVTGTLPSKTLKETALYLSGKYDKGLFGIDRDIQGETSVQHFMYRKNYIIKTQSNEVKTNLDQHKIKVYHGIGSFVDEHHVKVRGEKEEVLEADFILIATGSYPFHPPHIPFDQKRVHDSDSILDITRFPKSLAVLGAGVIGCEYATIFSTMGTKVFLINTSKDILSFIDRQIVEAFIKHMKNDQIELLFEKSVKAIQIPKDDNELLEVVLDSEERLHVDMFLFAAGRCGQTKALNLPAVGISVSSRETITVDQNYMTICPTIYAVGDVIGFPALASTGMDQGRVAVAHMLKTKDIEHLPTTIPFGIYTVPEISCVGVTEQQMEKENAKFAVGIAKYTDMARGQILGSTEGLCKLIFTKDDLIVRGVHILGNLATEIIHHGSDLIKSKATLLDIIGQVYNFPTLHDLYKYAAYDGLGNLSGHKMKK